LGKTCCAEDPNLTLNRARDTGFDLNQLNRTGNSLSRQKYLDGGRAGK
jgi:DNA polymerase epsilon subunit 1